MPDDLSTYMPHQQRVNRGKRWVREYAAHHDGHECEPAIGDLIADVLHYAEASGYGAAQALDSALLHYTHEAPDDGESLDNATTWSLILK